MDMRFLPSMRRMRTATLAALLIAPTTLQSSTFADDAPPSNVAAAVQSTSDETKPTAQSTEGQTTSRRKQAAPARKPTLVERMLGIRKNKPTPQRNAKSRGKFQRKDPKSLAKTPAAKPAQVAQEVAPVEAEVRAVATSETPVTPEAVEPQSPFTGLKVSEDPAGMQELAASAESAAPAQADEPATEETAEHPQVATHDDPFDHPEAMADDSAEDLENLDLNDEQLSSPIAVKESEQEIAESTRQTNSKWQSKQKHPLQSVKHADSQEAAEQHEQEEVIAETKSTALDSICLVTLRDKRRLVTGRSQFSTTVKGHKHLFASAAAKAVFDENPNRYLPAADGCDVVLQASGEESCEGSLEKAVWYSSRLYLFATTESLQKFVSTPEKYAIE